MESEHYRLPAPTGHWLIGFEKTAQPGSSFLRNCLSQRRWLTSLLNIGAALPLLLNDLLLTLLNRVQPKKRAALVNGGRVFNRERRWPAIFINIELCAIVLKLA